MAAPALYPPAPANVPPQITQVPGAYRLRVFAMIGGLFCFLIVYLLFIALAGLLTYALLVMPIPEIKGKGILLFLIFKFGGAAAAVMLFLFLVKGLFKGRKVERSTYVPLEEKNFPELFAFIRQVYRDVGAPAPRRVYASPEVNAALVYNTSLLNLVIPPRKDLLIGLGLVNVLNLAEFKAVLAHEFGHFAQRSVGLGSYLYVANQVMSDVIYSRDGLDRFLDNWSAQDVRISFPAWALKGVLWVVRKILAGTYQGLNLLHLSLSRQLEYNADNVAVSVTGSDSLVNCLCRMDFASECLNDAIRSLDAAADHNLFSDDLLFHQEQSAARLRRLKKDERAGIPPELPADPKAQVEVFPQIDDGIPDRYRSHPTEHMREKNAKRIYIRSPQDNRSPWLLFKDLPKLKSDVTDRLYRHVLERKERYTQTPAAEVQAFVDAEHAESTYDPKYHGFYDERFINPGELGTLPDTWSQHDVDHWLPTWPPADLPQRLEGFQSRRSEYQLLGGLKSGELKLKGKTFKFRDTDYTTRDVSRLYDQVDKELDADIASFHELDRNVFVAHLSLARGLDHGRGESHRETELMERYRFHHSVQQHTTHLMGQETHLRNVYEYISNNPKMESDAFQQVTAALKEIHSALDTLLIEAKNVNTPELTNVPAGVSLRDLIVDRSDIKLHQLHGDSISGEWIAKLGTRLDEVLKRLKRLHFKSLGSLLACQERLVSEWTMSGPTAKHPPAVVARA